MNEESQRNTANTVAPLATLSNPFIKRNYTRAEFFAGVDKIRTSFEDLYGVNKETRSPRQWSNLVARYGIAQVMETDKMTEKQVIDRCKEKFSDKLKRMFKNK